MTETQKTAPVPSADKMAAGAALLKFVKPLEELIKLSHEITAAGSMDALVNSAKAEHANLQERIADMRATIQREWEQFDAQKNATLRNIQTANDQLDRNRANADAYVQSKHAEADGILAQAKSAADKVMEDAKTAGAAFAEQVKGELKDVLGQLEAARTEIGSLRAEHADKTAAVERINKALAAVGMKGIDLGS